MRLLHNLLRDPNTALRGARKQQFQCTLTLRSKVMRELNAYVQACCNVRAKKGAVAARLNDLLRCAGSLAQRCAGRTLRFLRASALSFERSLQLCRGLI